VETIQASLVEVVRQRLTAGLRVRRFLPGGGVLHIERPLPFLLIYRQPRGSPDLGTRRLVVGESSYLVASSDESAQAAVAELVTVAVETLAERFNAFLLLEIWSGPAADSLTERPTFVVHSSPGELARSTVAAMMRSMRRIALDWRRQVVTRQSGGHAPRGLPPLLTTDQARRHACLMLGLQVPPIYRDPHSGAIYPRMLEHFRMGLSRALKETFFTFARVQTRATVEHYQALGRRALGQAVWKVDQQLAEIDGEFDFLLAVTPVNTVEALAAFEASRFERAPVFHYRLLSIDPDLLKRKLYEIPIEKVEDPAMAELFRKKRIELDRKISMIQDRQTRHFYHDSMQLYGEVDDRLAELARQILAELPRSGEVRQRRVGAAEFAKRAQEVIDSYQRSGKMPAKVEIRGDVPGIMVSEGSLLVGQEVQLSPARVEALIAHEVGTHLLTYFNGRAQRLQLLRCGLPGYEQLQEGIAVLSEWLVGGLNRQRLRWLAGRVVAVRRLIDGASFVEVFRELRNDFNFTQNAAFMISMRVFRGGGLTKDAVYLRGLVELLHHLSGKAPLEELLVGKISLESLPVIRELRWRQVLRPLLLRPHYLESTRAQHKLKRLKQGMSVLDLLKEQRA
jgi:uncharacterized protein (TIGR02421 family)